MNQIPFERTLLRELIGNAGYAERVLPFLQDVYFENDDTQRIFKLVQHYWHKHKACPSFSIIGIGIDGVASKDITEKEAKDAKAQLELIKNEDLMNASQQAWLLEFTEKWIKDRALVTALHKSIAILREPEKVKETQDAIPGIMRDALAVSLDTHIGHDYFADANQRYDYYHATESRLPFDLESLNKLTRGGVTKKTLNVILAGTNVGKSLVLCHLAAGYVGMSKNVLYITCEMAEQWVAHRIDANRFNIPMADVEDLPQADFNKKITQLRQTSTGRLIIKEFPPGYAHIGHIRTLLQELNLKQHFIPDVILIDYLTIVTSETVKLGSVNSFTFYKQVAEELRALAVEFNVPLWTAAQFNREGFKSTDPGMEHVGESFGIVQTADFIVALVSSEELEKLGQIALFELKTRYNTKRSYEQHLLGIDTPRMKLYELSAQQQAAAKAATAMSLPPAGGSATSNPSGFSSARGRRSKPMGSLKDESSDASNELP